MSNVNSILIGQDTTLNKRLVGPDKLVVDVKNRLLPAVKVPTYNSDSYQTDNHELTFSSRASTTAQLPCNKIAARVTTNSGIAKITATPLRRPVRHSNSTDLGFVVNDKRHAQFNVSYHITSKYLSGLRSYGDEHTGRAQMFDHTVSLSKRSSSLASLNVEAHALDNAFAAPPTPEDDCIRLVDSQCDKFQDAATIIQRAFRKYQICKRFRAITEQLRQTYPSSNLSASVQDYSLQKDDNNDSGVSNESMTQNRHDSSSNTIPYASGTTKVATWESLSLAASQLAANTAKHHQLLTVTQTVSSTGSSPEVPVTPIATKLAYDESTQATGQPLVSGRKNLTISASASTAPVKPIKADTVVGAAINFQQLEAIRKRQYRVGLNIFNNNPDKGISFLIAHSFIDTSMPGLKNQTYYLSNQLQLVNKKQLFTQPSKACHLCNEEENLKRNIAHFLLNRKGLAKEKIGNYLGNLQNKFSQDVLKYFLLELDFSGLQVDIALRKFSATLRMPGEAQKIERFVDYFAQRYVECQQQQSSVITKAIAEQNNLQLSTQQRHQESNQNDDNLIRNSILLSKDEAFILTFAIIMLNTDLHSPSMKPASRMSPSQFVNNLRGVFRFQAITEKDLIDIYGRVKANQIATGPDHVTHVIKVQQRLTITNFQKKELSNLCLPHRRLVCSCRLFEVYDVNKKERVGQHQREIFLFNDLLLVTKLAGRTRGNSTQSYAYRHSIQLQGLYVHLFHTAHYNYGIRLCRRSNAETLIMFNARNELDQSRFVDDLTESIAEMDEMEAIRALNIVETYYFRHQNKLKQHANMHNVDANNDGNSAAKRTQSNSSEKHQSGTDRSLATSGKLIVNDCDNLEKLGHINEAFVEENKNSSSKSNKIIKTDIGARNQSSSSQQGTAQTHQKLSGARRLQKKFSSMFNLSNIDEDNDVVTSVKGSNSNERTCAQQRSNRSFMRNQPNKMAASKVPTINEKSPADQLVIKESSELDAVGSSNAKFKPQSQSNALLVRSCSSNSVRSLDSGMFLSRDVSPNQSN